MHKHRELGVQNGPQGIQNLGVGFLEETSRKLVQKVPYFFGGLDKVPGFIGSSLSM